jgi:hypothetical protein
MGPVTGLQTKPEKSSEYEQNVGSGEGGVYFLSDQIGTLAGVLKRKPMNRILRSLHTSQGIGESLVFCTTSDRIMQLCVSTGLIRGPL